MKILCIFWVYREINAIAIVLRRCRNVKLGHWLHNCNVLLGAPRDTNGNFFNNHLLLQYKANTGNIVVCVGLHGSLLFCPTVEKPPPLFAPTVHLLHHRAPDAPVYSIQSWWSGLEVDQGQEEERKERKERKERMERKEHVLESPAGHGRDVFCGYTSDHLVKWKARMAVAGE